MAKRLSSSTDLLHAHAPTLVQSEVLLLLQMPWRMMRWLTIPKQACTGLDPSQPKGRLATCNAMCVFAMLAADPLSSLRKKLKQRTSCY